jgi:hypothetical protein
MLVIGGIGPYNKQAQKTGCDSIGRAGSSLACSSSSLLSQLLETWYFMNKVVVLTDEDIVDKVPNEELNVGALFLLVRCTFRGICLSEG